MLTSCFCRYFQMVVGLYGAVSGGETFLLAALVSERIIVRVTTASKKTGDVVSMDRDRAIDPSARLQTQASSRWTGTPCGSAG